jgi:hypothetical protein
MEFWEVQLDLARRRIGEIEDKISLQQERAQQLDAQGGDTGLHMRLIAVMDESLARAKFHARYIEERIAVLKSDPGRGRLAGNRSPAGGQTRRG